MDSSNMTTSTTNSTTSNYQEIPLSSFLNFPQPPPPLPPPPSSSSPSPSFFDILPSYLPTFHQEPSSSSQPSQPPSPPAAAAAAPRSNKKRSRASRRAPTTVLTTDTSNFRAMVQEFTGFPAPPFSTSSLPHPPRFDHLSASSSSSSPYFLSRPFPQKLPTPSSLVDAIAAAAAAANAAAYPFPNAASMIGIQNQNNILAPPPPQFGDHLTSFVAANTEGMQPQQHIRPSWAVHDPQDPDDQFQQQEKRQKTSGADGGGVEPWIHSSD